MNRHQTTEEILSPFRRIEKGLALQFNLSKILVSSDNLRSALRECILLLCEELGWSYGDYWTADPTLGELEFVFGVGLPHVNFEPMIAMSQQVVIHKGDLLIGQVWARGETLWTDGLSERKDFHRREAATISGLKTAIAIPVMTANEVMGVLELLSTENRRPDADLTDVLNTVGNQLGLFVERIRTHERLRESEARQLTLIESSLDSMVGIDARETITEFNPAAQKIFGYTRAEVLGKPVCGVIFPPRLCEEHKLQSGLHLKPGQSLLRVEISAMRSDGTEFPAELTVVPTPGREMGHTMFIRDLSQQKKVENRLRFTLGIAEALTRSLELEETLNRFAEILIPDVCDGFSVHTFNDSPSVQTLFFEHGSPEKKAQLKEYLGKYGSDLASIGANLSSLKMGKPQLIPNISESMMGALSTNKQQVEGALSIGARSLMVLPLRSRGKVLGAVSLFITDSARRFSPEDLTLAEDVAGHAALAIDHALLYKKSQEELAARRQAEKMAKDSEERYRAFLTQSSEAIWRFELDLPMPLTLSEAEQIEWFYQHCYLAECNDAMAHMYGLESAEQIQGSRLGQMLVRDNANNVQFLHSWIRSGYRLVNAESEEVDVHGNRKFFSNNFIGIIEEGRLVRAWGLQRDVTDQHRAAEFQRESEAKVRRSESNLALAQQIAHIGSWEMRFQQPFNLEESAVDWSDEVFRICGYEPGAIVPNMKTFMDAVPESERERLVAAGERAVKSGVPYSLEHHLKRPSGEVRVVQEQAQLIRDSSGRPLKFVGTIQDVTDRIHTEQALRESEERYRSLVGAMTSVVLATDGSGQFAHPQLSWHKYTGQSWEDQAGMGWLEKIHPDDRLIFRSEWGQAMQSATLLRVAVRVWSQDAQDYHHTLLRAVPLKNLDGTVREWVGTITDINDRVQAEESLRKSEAHVRKLNEELESRVHERTAQLEQTNEELKRQISEREAVEKKLARQTHELARSNQELEQFAYVASHDLREPLRMISSYAQLLTKKYKGQFDENGESYLGYMIDGVARMHALIDDLLTYSRVGRGELSPEAVDLNQLVDTVVAEMRETLEQSSAQVRHDSLPTVNANPSQFRRLFQNLIGNAVKFKGDRAPVVDVKVVESPEEWTFSVEDNGIGIEHTYFDRIFVIFQRLHTREEYPGTGIGLAICKKVVQRHGGRIWVESQPGAGSKFLFTLPKKIRRAPAT